MSEIRDEKENLEYLKKIKFDKNLKKLNKKLKDKTIVLYGAGAYLEVIKKYFDLSELNIIGVCDKRFYNHETDEEFLGYKVYSIDEIKELNPDYILISTKKYIETMDELCFNVFLKSKIKIKPLVKKSFLVLLKEIWYDN